MVHFSGSKNIFVDAMVIGSPYETLAILNLLRDNMKADVRVVSEAWTRKFMTSVVKVKILATFHVHIHAAQHR